MGSPKYNPYHPINLQTRREERERAAVEQGEKIVKQRTFNLLMSANQKSTPKPKENDAERVRRGKQAAATRKRIKRKQKRGTIEKKMLTLRQFQVAEEHSNQQQCDCAFVYPRD
jgi:hypothetical protein